MSFLFKNPIPFLRRKDTWSICTEREKVKEPVSIPFLLWSYADSKHRSGCFLHIFIFPLCFFALKYLPVFPMKNS